VSRSHPRDRHGRGLRTELFAAPVPAKRSRAAHFARMAGSLFDELRARAAGQLDRVVLAVDFLPDPTAAEPRLAATFNARAEGGHTIVVYRAPALAAADPLELREALLFALAQEAAGLCSFSAEELLGR
jgi:hypothetical protein